MLKTYKGNTCDFGAQQSLAGGAFKATRA